MVGVGEAVQPRHQTRLGEEGEEEREEEEEQQQQQQQQQ